MARQESRGSLSRAAICVTVLMLFPCADASAQSLFSSKKKTALGFAGSVSRLNQQTLFQGSLGISLLKNRADFGFFAFDSNNDSRPGGGGAFVNLWPLRTGSKTAELFGGLGLAVLSRSAGGRRGKSRTDLVTEINAAVRLSSERSKVAVILGGTFSSVPDPVSSNGRSEGVSFLVAPTFSINHNQWTVGPGFSVGAIGGESFLNFSLIFTFQLSEKKNYAPEDDPSDDWW